MRRVRLLMLALVMALSFGCVTSAPDRALDELCKADPSSEACLEGISVEVRYYALVADYVRVKGAAAVYAETPSTPRSHIVKIMEIVDEADAVLCAIEDQRRSGALISDNTYVLASRMLRSAVIRLNAEIAKGAI